MAILRRKKIQPSINEPHLTSMDLHIQAPGRNKARGTTTHLPFVEDLSGAEHVCGLFGPNVHAYHGL